MPEVVIPNAWSTRTYQDPAWQFMVNGGKRAVLVWHRRAGKDATAANFTVFAAHQRVGNYWHLFPEAKQGRKALWEGISADGRKFIDQLFPDAIREPGSRGKREDEMLIRLRCGSTWQVLGSDTYNSNIGANPVGIVFSEYSVSDPMAWTYMRPILRENGGWAIFPYTPRGANHGKELYDMASGNPDWFAQILTVNDTGRLTSEDIEQERREGMDEAMIRQEFYCSFEGYKQGAYYADALTTAREQGRICAVPYDPELPVETYWDLGLDDHNAIIFAQRRPTMVACVDYYENNNKGTAHYAKVLGEWAMERDARYSRHILPHDANKRDAHTFRPEDDPITTKDQYELLGVRPVEIVTEPNLATGINMARAFIGRCYFDNAAVRRDGDGYWGMQRLIECLSNYSREWDDKAKKFKDRPNHNWASHGADAFRMGARAGEPATSFTPIVEIPRNHVSHGVV